MRQGSSRLQQRVAGFELVEQVAAGPLATVYRARGATGWAAIKIYEPEQSARWSERVHREADVQAKLAHPCVARLHGAGVLDDGAFYLASEWIEGRRLEDRLGGGPIEWDELAPIAWSISRGLHAIHAAGVVHRDLKPSNVMLPRAGEPPAVILDFGHALLLDDERLTETGQILGTASYTAPEQAAGRPLDGRADLYALGVILYRGLTGFLPFDGPSAAEVLRRHVSEPVVRPSLRAPARAIPRAVEDLCMWLLAKEPEARVPSTRVLVLTLQGMARELSVA